MDSSDFKKSNCFSKDWKSQQETLQVFKDNHQVELQNKLINPKDIKQEKQSYNDIDEDIKLQLGHNQVYNQDDKTCQFDSHVETKDFECIICIKCNKWFKCVKHLDNHEKILHRGERCFKCTYCDKMFAHRNSWKIHQEIHACKDKSVGAESNKDLENDEERQLNSTVCIRPKKQFQTVQKTYRCSRCGRTFSKKFRLNHHHYQEEKPFKCPICHKAFLTNSDVKTHILILHMKIDPLSLKCTLCGIDYKSERQLMIHQKMYHRLAVEKPHECTICKKAFPVKQDLYRHSLIHTGEKQFQCKLCNRAFTLKGNLTQHLLTHNGEKHFKCAVCGRGFAAKSGLHRHLKVHSRRKPFVCSICPKAYPTKFSLNRHEKTHSSELNI